MQFLLAMIKHMYLVFLKVFFMSIVLCRYLESHKAAIHSMFEKTFDRETADVVLTGSSRSMQGQNQWLWWIRIGHMTIYSTKDGRLGQWLAKQMVLKRLGKSWKNNSPQIISKA